MKAFGARPLLNTSLVFFLRYIALAIASSAIVACGWQLRGYEPKTGELVAAKTLDSLDISSSARNSDSLRAIKKNLTNQGIVIDKRSEIKLVLDEESLRRQPLTYRRSGIPAQYQLTVSLEYYVSRNNEVLVEQRTIVTRRNYDFDPNLIIAKDREEESLLEEMRQEISSRIITSIKQAL